MNDTAGFFYLFIVVVGAIAGPIAIFISLWRKQQKPGAIGALLVTMSICCSLPFQNTYEAPWLPGVVIIYFFAIVAISGVYLIMRNISGSNSNSNMRIKFGIVSLVLLAIFLTGAFSWVEFANKNKLARSAAIEEVNSWSPTINFLNNALIFDNEHMTDDDLPRMISGLQQYPVDLKSIDFSKTAVTEEGIEQLQSAIPDCNIYR